MTQRRRDLEIEGNPIPRNWEETIAACLAKDPAKRPQSVAEIAHRLQLISQQTPALAPVVPAKPSRKKALFIASAAAAICIIAAAAWYFGIHTGGEKASTKTPLPMVSPSAPTPQLSPAGTASGEAQPSTAVGPPTTTLRSPAAVAAPPPAVAQSTPGTAVLSAAERPLQEATALREQVGTNNALAHLQDAAQRDPKNANVLAEMAMTYESMGALDRSNETWRKIAEIGPSAGALYELADMKLKVGVAPSPSTTTTGPGFAGVSPLDAGTTRSDPEGIPDGSTFGIAESSVTENPDPDADTNLTLRVGVKKRVNSIADHNKVKIQVYFYDTLDNNKVALTDADVNYQWLTPNHDWKSTNPEVISVSYIRLKKDALSSEAARPPLRPTAPATKKPQGPARKYAGYQVRLYYNDQLQDVRAEPSKLLRLFPPPLTLTSQ